MVKAESGGCLVSLRSSSCGIDSRLGLETSPNKRERVVSPQRPRTNVVIHSVVTVYVFSSVFSSQKKCGPHKEPQTSDQEEVEKWGREEESQFRTCIHYSKTNFGRIRICQCLLFLWGLSLS